MLGMHAYKGDIIDICRLAPGEGTGCKAVITCNTGANIERIRLINISTTN